MICEGIARRFGVAGTGSAQESKEALADDVLDELVKAIKRLTYGTITLKVHNARITQMEITEKKRFDEALCYEKGGGI